ncbi:MAG: UvrD-helicase domain-containing protein [Porphyromonadaceae bacterium]|nr:UvrD-helicase domain-containing protein [Porphyromonadaceae bacterium]
MNKAYLEELNEAQREAVLYCDGPSLVIAGAGSGKTRVLTYKIAHLLASENYQPSEILALTFTNKAAREMKERVAAIVGGRLALRLWMGTFHAIFASILHTHAERIGFTHDFTIYDQSDSRSLIKTILKERSLDDKLYRPTTVQALISNAKNALITPAAYASNPVLIEGDQRARRPLMAEIYKEYWSRCARSEAMDFDDLLLYTNILFRDHPDVLAFYQEQFRYILVDEYQDTNFAQHLIINQLAKAHRHLCVVGDDAQSIYSFRGANIGNILHFQKEYPDFKIFKLEQNYRSTQTIVAAANSLIAKNKEQIPKHIYSRNAVGEKIPVIGAYSDFEEGYVIAGRIVTMRMEKGGSYSDFAILYRTNSQSRIFEEALRKRNIPYRIYGGQSFYQRKEIKDVIAYFRLAVNPSDEEALKRVINYPARGIGETTWSKIAACAVAHEVSLWEVVSHPDTYALPVNSGTQNKLTAFSVLIQSFVEKSNQESAYAVADTIVRQSGIMTDIYADRSLENISRQENVEELLNGIQEFCSLRQEEGVERVSLTDFLAEVSLATDQDSDDEGDKDRVMLMTVHASKGLEFRHVFVVGLEEELFPTAMAMDNARELEEERRLLYVAITRAKESCQLSYAASRYRNGKPTASPPSRFLQDIDPAYLQLSDSRTLERGEERPAFPSRRIASNYLSERFERPSGFSGTSRSVTTPLPSTFPSQTKLVRIETSSAPSVGFSVTILPEGLVVGGRIRHDRFGEGTVTEITGEGDNLKIGVAFDHVGQKHLLLKFAKFTILK